MPSIDMATTVEALAGYRHVGGGAMSEEEAKLAPGRDLSSRLSVLLIIFCCRRDWMLRTIASRFNSRCRRIEGRQRCTVNICDRIKSPSLSSQFVKSPGKNLSRICAQEQDLAWPVGPGNREHRRDLLLPVTNSTERGRVFTFPPPTKSIILGETCTICNSPSFKVRSYTCHALEIIAAGGGGAEVWAGHKDKDDEDAEKGVITKIVPPDVPR
eukprot:753476-Hanusia_phi.AAC.8